MKFDDLASAWQEQNDQSLSPEDREAIIARVCRRVERLSGVVIRRDVIETIAAVVVIIFFGGFMYNAPTDYVVSKFGAGFLVCWALFIIYKMHRTRTIQRPAPIDAPVREFCRIELDRLDRQIQLLGSVLWWYIAPCIIGVNIMFVGLAGLGIDSLAYCIFTLLLAWAIYALNMRAVAKCLAPSRNELANLNNQLEGADVAEQPTQPPLKAARPFSVVFLLVTLAPLGCLAALFAWQTEEYPKLAPFSAIRWEGNEPMVKIGDEWLRLVSLDGVAAEDIVSFSRWTYMDRWRKRFEEDLVEVLTRMGHEPRDTVRLVVSPLGSRAMRTLEDVPMTEANRWAIYNANSRACDQPSRSSGPAGDSLASLITDLRNEKNLVGLAAMVMVDGQVEAAAAYGQRKIGSDVPLEISDRWHLGGITKSITATMIARLVESGQMQWSDTVGEIFPEAAVHEDWKPVTLKQLLTDTAGAPRSFPKEVLRQRPALGPECTQARREAVLNVIAVKPAYPPGKEYAYSNVGYTIAGAMVEKLTGATWEDLVKREVFEPLELAEAGFGPPKSADETLEQPRGHRAVLSGKVSVDDEADNTAIMGPAGIAHMSLRNLCTYAEEHLLGDLGTGKLLAAETYNRLHTPELDDYACGWLRKEPSAETPHTVYWHNGSNTMWYALVAFIPEKNMVVAVTSNDGDFASAEAAAWEVVKASVKQNHVGAELPLGEEYPKKSPFAAVRWRQSQPQVKVGEEWFKLVSLDELPTSEIVAFSQRTYGNKWQKRFEEDLVELLSRMGHPPQDTVKLVVQSLTSGETQDLEDVPMTEANRQAIKAAALSREISEP